jgi:hypothetical protein
LVALSAPRDDLRVGQGGELHSRGMKP